MRLSCYMFFFFPKLVRSSFFLPFQACAQTMEKLTAGQHVTEEELELLGQLPDPAHGYSKFYSELCRTILKRMKSDPVVTLLTVELPQQQNTSLELLFDKAEAEDSAEVCYLCSCTYLVVSTVKVFRTQKMCYYF